MSDDSATAWTQVLDEMTSVSSELSADGWETLASPAGDTGVTDGDDRSLDPGFVHVIPDDDADTFADWFVPDGFERTEVYRATTPDQLYLLTVLFDEPSERAILVAGVVDRASLPACRSAAEEAGHVHTHLRRVDGTHLGSFRHADPDAFFPE